MVSYTATIKLLALMEKKVFQLNSLHDYLQDKQKAEFIVRREEYFDSTRYIVDVTKVIEIENVKFLSF